MKSPVRPELPTAALRSSQATLAAVDNSASFLNRLDSTYKSGKAVQTTGATSCRVHLHSLRLIPPQIDTHSMKLPHHRSYVIGVE